MKIILMPGLNGTEGLFKPFINKKPDYIEIVNVIYPTHEEMSYSELTQYVLKKLESIRDDFILVGESFSGPLALFVAQKNPKGLKGIVLVSTFISPPNLKIGKYLPWVLGFKLTKPLYKIRSVLSKSKNMFFIEAISKELQKVSPHVLANRIKSVYSVNAHKALLQCHVPMVYFRGKYDIVVPKKNLVQMLMVRKDISVVEFPTQHFLLQSTPIKAWDAINSFMKNNSLETLK